MPHSIIRLGAAAVLVAVAFAAPAPAHLGAQHRRARRGGWFSSWLSSWRPQSPPPEEQPQSHEYGDDVGFKLRRIQSSDIIDELTPCPETHPEAMKGVFWLDQFGTHAESDVSAVAAADTCISFGESAHYVLPEPEVVTVDGETHTLRNRFDVEVFGAGAWVWIDEGGEDSAVENHSFNIASLIKLYYKFIWNDSYTFCRIVFTANLLGVEIEMPGWLASYWIKRGWKGEDDPAGLTWDRISYIGPQWLQNVFHYPVFKVYDSSNEKTEHFDSYLKLANCKCQQSDGVPGAETPAKALFESCMAGESEPKCTTSAIGYEYSRGEDGAHDGEAAGVGGWGGHLGNFVKAGAIGA